MVGVICLFYHLSHPTHSQQKHRCTVVGNPGGGSLFFLPNSFQGGTWGCEKIRGVVFYCIFIGKFFKNLYRGFMRCPPLSPHPVCIYEQKYLFQFPFILNKKQLPKHSFYSVSNTLFFKLRLSQSVAIDFSQILQLVYNTQTCKSSLTYKGKVFFTGSFLKRDNNLNTHSYHYYFCLIQKM